jgi:hypothetical protein
MYNVEFSADELRLVRSALRSYLNDFGHDEKDVLRTVRQLVAKLDRAEATPDAASEQPA